MNTSLKKLIEKLIDKKYTISTMESCTGGGLANAITNIEGSSDVFKYGAVTYSNEYKIKMGVSKAIIDEYSVYSKEVAREMSKNISLFTFSDYGIGITGKLNKEDKNNLFGDDNTVFISIYSRSEDKFYDYKFIASCETRSKNKDSIVNFIVSELLKILK